MKGQITIVNLIGVLFALILYYFMLPVLNQVADQTVTTISATPNQFTPFTIMLIYAIPFFILVGIVLTTFNYAIPGRVGIRGR